MFDQQICSQRAKLRIKKFDREGKNRFNLAQCFYSLSGKAD